MSLIRAYPHLILETRGKLLAVSAAKSTPLFDRFFRPGCLCWVVFQFKTDQRPITLRAQVKKPLYERAELDATISVRYNATTPRTALLEGEYGIDDSQSRIGI